VGSRLRGEYLRILLAVLVIAMAGKLAIDMTATPDRLFSTAVVQ
jgi:uncharacterized protein